MKHRKSDNLIFVVIGIILLLSIITDTLFMHQVELQKRQQARYNLEQLQHCISVMSRDTYYKETEIYNICTAKSRTSSTGDVYILNFNSLEFIYENSSDVPSGLFFSRESVGKYFKDYNSAEIALSKIMLGKDSEERTNAYYIFDGEIEWLEWKTEYINDKKIVIVQGIQKDEVFDSFSFTRILAGIFVFLVIMLLLIFHKIGIIKRSEIICPIQTQTT